MSAQGSELSLAERASAALRLARAGDADAGQAVARVLIDSSEPAHPLLGGAGDFPELRFSLGAALMESFAMSATARAIADCAAALAANPPPAGSWEPRDPNALLRCALPQLLRSRDWPAFGLALRHGGPLGPQAWESILQVDGAAALDDPQAARAFELALIFWGAGHHELGFFKPRSSLQEAQARPVIASCPHPACRGALAARARAQAKPAQRVADLARLAQAAAGSQNSAFFDNEALGEIVQWAQTAPAAAMACAIRWGIAAPWSALGIQSVDARDFAGACFEPDPAPREASPLWLDWLNASAFVDERSWASLRGVSLTLGDCLLLGGRMEQAAQEGSDFAAARAVLDCFGPRWGLDERSLLSLRSFMACPRPASCPPPRL